MLEEYGFYLLLAGVLLFGFGYLWMVVTGFKVHWLWGIGNLFLPGALVFALRHFVRARTPLLIVLLGGLVFATPFALNYYETHFVPLAPYEQIVDGERRITLTGLTNFDYATLRKKPDTVVLQMANADVTDGTLQYIKHMDKLRNLDVSGTGITDEGLRVLAGMPQLQEIRLARTHITDEGFKTILSPCDNVLKLDLTGTEVKGKTMRDWKKLQPEKRDYVD
jgi:hypothetical protein